MEEYVRCQLWMEVKVWCNVICDAPFVSICLHISVVFLNSGRRILEATGSSAGLAFAEAKRLRSGSPPIEAKLCRAVFATCDAQEVLKPSEVQLLDFGRSNVR